MSATNQLPTFVFVEDEKSLASIFGFALEKALPGMKSAGKLESMKAALDLLPGLNPAVVIIDYHLGRLGEGTGVDVVRQLAPKLPHTKWLLFTGNPQAAIHDAIQAGIHGCVSKKSEYEELVVAIKTILGGGSYYCKESTAAMLSIVRQPSDQLSETERKIMRCIAAGKEPKSIAEELGIGIKTVHNSMALIRTKLAGKIGSGSLVELARYAVEVGLAPAS